MLSEAFQQIDELSEAVRDEDVERSVVALPTLDASIEMLSELVTDKKCVGVIIIDGSQLGTWERHYGSTTFALLMNKLARATKRMRGSILRADDHICLDRVGGESLFIFLGPAREDGPTIDFEDIFVRIKAALVEPEVDTEHWFHEALEQISIGSALVIRNQALDPRREIYRSIRRAYLDASVNHRESQRQRHRIIGRMIAQQKIKTLYQPIVSLSDNAILGFEALSRADGSDANKLGIHLFVAAAHAQLDGELDDACRELSVSRRPQLDPDICLFVNCLPSAFSDNRELDLMLNRWEADGLRPAQLVFEMTENITHEQLNRILPNVKRLRERGYQFAMDDVGTGSSNLQVIADLEPNFIKMDISLTKGISSSDRKRVLASYLLELSEKTGAKMIAEGIENQADCLTLLELGVEYGQGFLFGRPGPAT